MTFVSQFLCRIQASLQNAGFDTAMLTVSFFDGRFDPLALKQANFSPQALKSAGFTAQALRDIGFDLKSLLPPVFDVFTLAAAGILPEEIASIKVAPCHHASFLMRNHDFSDNRFLLLAHFRNH